MDLFFSYTNILLSFSDQYFILSILIFLFFLILSASISLPGLSIIAVLSGYLHGFFLGYLIIMIGLTTGSLIFYIFSKLFYKKLFSNYYKKYSENLTKYIQNSSYEYLIIFRMIPGPPLFLQNFLISLLNIPYHKFIISTFIGLTPFNLTAVYIGNKINNLQSIKNISSKDILTWDLLIVVLLIIFILLVRIKIKKRPS